LRIQLLVYLMVTKCDLVDGFAEYFEDLTAEGRAQVWGVTFPYEQTLANEGPQVFPAEFDALMTRLNERVFGRVEEERNARRRTKVFAFPQQMATMRDALTQWVSDVFASRDFSGRILLRGVYFTSGTQEGTPIDRLLGSIGRAFGTADAVMKPAGRGKAYFVESLLKQVMIGESGLAGVNRRLELRNASLQLGAYARRTIAAAGVAALSVSYHGNRGYLNQTAADIAAFGADRRGHRLTARCDGPRLDAIRAVVDSSTGIATTSWRCAGGCIRAIDRQFRSRCVSARARQHPLPGSPADQVAPETVPRIPALRLSQGYLMLRASTPGRHLQMLAEIEWKGAERRASRAGASATLQSPAGEQRLAPAAAARGTLVAQARSSLGQTPRTRILYEGLKRAYADETGQGLRLDQLAGLDVERVFKRRSGIPLSTPMPRVYTREVFKQIVTQGRAELVQQVAKDAWVWDESATASVASAGTLVSGVTNEYELDSSGRRTRCWTTCSLCHSGPSSNQRRAAHRPSTSPLRHLRVVADSDLVETVSAPRAWWTRRR
jgi:type VI secretion system protein ImpL